MRLEYIRAEDLELSPFQRDLSSGTVNKLRRSIERLGFLIPLVVVEVDKSLAEKLKLPAGKFLVVDGQHRFKAGLACGMEKFPCVITKRSVLNFPLHLNIEKADNVKDKATKVHRLYLRALEFSPETSEVSAFQLALEQDGSYVIPLAFGYCEKGLKSPSLVEDFVKKCASWTELPLKEAVALRRKEGEMLAGLEAVITFTAETHGISDFVLKKTMLAIAMKERFGEARGKRTLVNIDVDMQTAVSELGKVLTEKDWQFLTAKKEVGA